MINIETLQAETLQKSISALLNKAGFASKALHIENCLNGKNNRTYRVSTDQGFFIIKKYFQLPEDKRDRLKSEFSFLSYANKLAPSQVPAPFAYDAENGMALYEFIDGDAFEINSVSEQDVEQAIVFFSRLNEAGAKMSAQALPTGSEACFTLQTHIDLINNRIHELQDLRTETSEDEIAQDNIQRLKLFWLAHVKKIQSLSDASEMNRPLDLSQRCISPSDFGFHNALRRADGSICFLDFEYAGWDDPAKMSGDFFSQLAVPVPQNYFDYFVRQVMACFVNPEQLVQRAWLLRYAYQVKWCCIALNIFLPTHLARRRFANPQLDVTGLKQTQLAKTAALIKNLESANNGND